MYPHSVLTCTHTLCFEQNQEKYQNFSAENFQFLKLKKSLYIAWATFRNEIKLTGIPFCSYYNTLVYVEEIHHFGVSERRNDCSNFQKE